MVPILGTLNIRCRIIIGIQKGTISLTTTHIYRERERLYGVIWGLYRDNGKVNGDGPKTHV